MRESEKVFSIGLMSFVFLCFCVAVLQVLYRVQNKNLEDVRRQMKNTQVEISKAENIFYKLTTSDSLRDIVLRVYPEAETVSYSKSIRIKEIPIVE